jgi:hypothetical protein
MNPLSKFFFIRDYRISKAQKSILEERKIPNLQHDLDSRDKGLHLRSEEVVKAQLQIALDELEYYTQHLSEIYARAKREKIALD